MVRHCRQKPRKAIRRKDRRKGGKRLVIGQRNALNHMHLRVRCQPQRLGQKRTVARLMRATPARIMRQCLTVEADQIDAGKPCQNLGMGIWVTI